MNHSTAHPGPAQRKAELRAKIIASRATMSDGERQLARGAITAAALAAWTQPGRVAAYEALRTEPGSPQLLAGLVAAGHQVIVPITQADNDLDWREWHPDGAESPPLGRATLGSTELVLVPAFAVDAAGNRLGRGGGSYDRALARVGDKTVVVAVLFEGEMVEDVPTDRWDLPVQAVLTPAGFTWLSRH